MKVVQARKELYCKFNSCRGAILKGDICIKYSFKNSQGSWVFLYFHQDCFIEREVQSLSKYIQEEKFRLQAKLAVEKPKKPRGRPTKPHTRERNNIKSAIWYYKKVGNLDKVVELEDKLLSLQ